MMQILDPHVLVAMLCVIGAMCVSAGLVIWLAIELEMKEKK